jgi:hypothetical protein
VTYRPLAYLNEKKTSENKKMSEFAVGLLDVLGYI